MSFAEKFASAYRKILPSPFSIALILTALTLILAFIFTWPEEKGFGEYGLNLISYWEQGLWNDGKGGLYFAFQMMFMLVLGHIIALSHPVSRVIDRLLTPCTTTARTAFIVTFSTILVSFFNWGLGLIFGAILARKAGEKFNRAGDSLNYPLIGASAYVGLMVWHGGLSGSAPIKASESGNIQELVTGIEGVSIANLPDSIPMESTVFSAMNITLSVALLIFLPLLMYWIGKRSAVKSPLPPVITSEKEEKNTSLSGAERIDHSRFFGITIGILILLYAFYKAFILPEVVTLKFLNPNFINFTLLGLALLFHQRIHSFLSAAGNAISGATGILLQFPLYFGILGIMVGSGLISQISDAFVAISSPLSFPVNGFLSAGIVNVFVPSGGGQWAVQGPIIIASAQEIGVPLPKAIMALAYGDQLTNMLQPFWALPLLGITGLKAKDILPYTLLLFLAGLVIFVSGLLLF